MHCKQGYIYGIQQQAWHVTGAFASSWLGGLALQLGEWIIKKLPLVKHIYSAAKQVRQCPFKGR